MFVAFKLYQSKLIMIILFQWHQQYNKKIKSIFFNDINNDLYYKKKLFKGIIRIMESKYKYTHVVCYTF